MRYNNRLIRDRQSSIYLKQISRQGPIMITSGEHRQLRPGEPAKRVDFIFRNTALLMDLDYGQFLLKKYSDKVEAINIKSGKRVALHDDLDKLGYNELIQLLARLNRLAVEQGFEKTPLLGKQAEIIQRIRNLRNMNVVLPATIYESKEDILVALNSGKAVSESDIIHYYGSIEYLIKHEFPKREHSKFDKDDAVMVSISMPEDENEL